MLVTGIEIQAVRANLDLVRDDFEAIVAECDAWKSRALTAEPRAEKAEKSAASWKDTLDMYAKAWIRELGGKVIPKSHEIDALVLTTRKVRENECKHLTATARPKAVLAWAVATFGAYANKPEERARRLLEEAVELAQALGVPKEGAAKILDRAYERPEGSPAKEVAQVGFTLEALAAVLGVDLSAAIDGEFARVRSKPKEHWAGRAAEKRAAGTEDVG